MVLCARSKERRFARFLLSLIVTAAAVVIPRRSTRWHFQPSSMWFLRRWQQPYVPKDHLATSLSHLGRFRGFVGTNLEQSWLILAQLASSWGSLGTLLDHLGAILDHLKIILMESWTISNPKPKFNDSFTFLRCFNLQWPSFRWF